jgi:AP endonuclease-1
MPPRRAPSRASARASTSAVPAKRERSTSASPSESELSDAPAITKAKPSPKGKGKTTLKKEDAPAKGRLAAISAIQAGKDAPEPRYDVPSIAGGDPIPHVYTEAEVAAGEEPPTKKARISKVNTWPPTDLDPAITPHPPRAGYPVYEFKAAGGEIKKNGSIAQGGKSPMLLGSHTSIAGGPATALLRASQNGANGLALFVKGNKQWKSKNYDGPTAQRFLDLKKSKEDGGV